MAIRLGLPLKWKFPGKRDTLRRIMALEHEWDTHKQRLQWWLLYNLAEVASGRAKLPEKAMRSQLQTLFVGPGEYLATAAAPPPEELTQADADAQWKAAFGIDPDSAEVSKFAEQLFKAGGRLPDNERGPGAIAADEADRYFNRRQYQ